VLTKRVKLAQLKVCKARKVVRLLKVGPSELESLSWYNFRQKVGNWTFLNGRNVTQVNWANEFVSLSL